MVSGEAHCHDARDWVLAFWDVAEDNDFVALAVVVQSQLDDPHDCGALEDLLFNEHLDIPGLGRRRQFSEEILLQVCHVDFAQGGPLVGGGDADACLGVDEWVWDGEVAA